MPSSTTASFASLLAAQVRNEFTASQQYAAVAVWFDNHDLPRLAAHFYRQSVEERNHAMMMVRHLLGEQFMGWFLKEQVEEVAAMSSLVTISERAKDNWFQIEDHLAREAVGDAGVDASAPAAAGGLL